MNNQYEEIIVNGVSKGQRLVSKNTINIRKITVRALRARFTMAEKVALETSTDPLVKVLLRDLEVAEFVDLDDPELQNGLALLSTDNVGIIDANRSTAILQNGNASEQPS